MGKRLSEFRLSEKTHHYGKNVHLLDDPFMNELLARFCSPRTQQPETNRLLTALSEYLSEQAFNFLLPKRKGRVITRMKAFHPEGEYISELFDPKTKAVVVDLMRAGILPSQTCYERLHWILQAQNIRQDHILLNRATNKSGQVVGVQLSGHKIGDSIANAYVFVPDPMGATGGTMESVMELYRQLSGKAEPKKFVALHLIVTPEYLRRLKPYAKVLEVFALRLDRGMSSSRILRSPLGKYWNQEKGLNDRQYIVPGAGGIGEILNNSFI